MDGEEDGITLLFSQSECHISFYSCLISYFTCTKMDSDAAFFPHAFWRWVTALLHPASIHLFWTTISSPPNISTAFMLCLFFYLPPAPPNIIFSGLPSFSSFLSAPPLHHLILFTCSFPLIFHFAALLLISQSASLRSDRDVGSHECSQTVSAYLFTQHTHGRT